MVISRRWVLSGVIAAPAIVAASTLMKINSCLLPTFDEADYYTFKINPYYEYIDSLRFVMGTYEAARKELFYIVSTEIARGVTSPIPYAIRNKILSELTPQEASAINNLTYSNLNRMGFY